MGSKSSSKTEYTTNNLGFSEVAGPAVAGDNNTIVQTDQGAVAAGAALAETSISENRRVTEAAIFGASQSFNESARTVRDSLGGALNFGQSALGTVERTNVNALSTVERSGNAALNFGGRAVDTLERQSGRTLDAVSSAYRAAAELVTQTAREATQSVTSYAAKQSTNNDQRITETTKFVVGAVAVLGAIMAFRS